MIIAAREPLSPQIVKLQRVRKRFDYNCRQSGRYCLPKPHAICCLVLGE